MWGIISDVLMPSLSANEQTPQKASSINQSCIGQFPDAIFYRAINDRGQTSTCFIYRHLIFKILAGAETCAHNASSTKGPESNWLAEDRKTFTDDKK